MSLKLSLIFFLQFPHSKDVHNIDDKIKGKFLWHMHLNYVDFYHQIRSKKYVRINIKRQEKWIKTNRRNLFNNLIFSQRTKLFSTLHCTICNKISACTTPGRTRFACKEQSKIENQGVIAQFVWSSRSSNILSFGGVHPWKCKQQTFFHNWIRNKERRADKIMFAKYFKRLAEILFVLMARGGIRDIISISFQEEIG